MSANKEFRAAYNAHLKAQNDRISREANAKAEGIAIGEARGKVEGKAEGIAEGELKKVRALALKMLKKGNSIEDIADLTELSVEEIESLKDKQ
jgi:predicted transposase/invertase (TIGR01784 family)